VLPPPLCFVILLVTVREFPVPAPSVPALCVTVKVIV